MGTIRITFDIITEESAADGDYAESGWEDEVGEEYTVDEAAKLLKGSEASSSDFHVGVWYTSYGDTDWRTGETKNLSYHLVEGTWTEAEERQVFDLVKGKS